MVDKMKRNIFLISFLLYWNIASSGFSFAQEVSQELKNMKPEDKISLSWEGTNILDILEFLSLEMGITIVPTNNVSGKASIVLKNISLQDALEVILINQGLAYEKKGSIINVMTYQEYENIYGRKYNERRQIKTVKLNYANPSVVFNAVEKIKSNIGKIIVDDKNGTVLLIDTPEYLSIMEAAIKQMDEPTEFDKEFSKAETSEQLEVLLKKYSNEEEKIIPKLESVIVSEIKTKGVGSRFIIREMRVGSGSSGSVTLQEATSGGMLLSAEFPSDGITISVSGGSKIPLGDGSIHRYVGKVELDADGNTVVGEGDKQNRLTFCLIKDIGYVYLRGKGKIALKDGKTITLPTKE